MVEKITPEVATELYNAFRSVGIVGEGSDWKVAYRDYESNFICNIHSNKKHALTVVVQNGEKNPALLQVVKNIVKPDGWF